MKFKPIPDDGCGPFDDPTGYWWVGHPRCERPGEKEHILIDNRDKLDFISGVSDPDADYSYDEYAIVKLDGVYFLCQTSGCSCPSPSETWYVYSFGTLEEAVHPIVNGEIEDAWVQEWLKDSMEIGIIQIFHDAAGP